MTWQENPEPSRRKLGRIDELRRLEACERGLADAWAEFGLGARGDTRWIAVRQLHLGHAALLAGRIRELGAEPKQDGDDEWILGSPRNLSTLVIAENSAMRTYHDHLGDLDLETLALVRDRILPAQEQTLGQLVGEPYVAVEP
jgi:hypothetical protein